MRSPAPAMMWQNSWKLFCCSVSFTEGFNLLWWEATWQLPVGTRNTGTLICWCFSPSCFGSFEHCNLVNFWIPIMGFGLREETGAQGRNPCRIQGQHAKSTQKGISQQAGSSLEPSCREVTALNTAPSGCCKFKSLESKIFLGRGIAYTLSPFNLGYTS